MDSSANIGDVFISNTTGYVDALGIYVGSATSYPYATSVTLGLYSSSNTITPMASVTISSSTTNFLYDGYLWTNLTTPVQVINGSTYTVVEFDNGNPIYVTTSTTSPAVYEGPVDNWATYVNSKYLYDNILAYPTNSGGEGNYFGANAMMGEPPPSGIPEPGTLILFGSGLLGMAGMLRHKFCRI
jgi:hypothetical protein